MAKKGRVDKREDRFWSGVISGQNFTNFYRLVKFGVGNQIVQCNDEDDIPIGVLVRQSPLEVWKLRYGEELCCEVGEILAVGDDVACGSDGRLRVASGGDYILGKVVLNYVVGDMATFYAQPRGAGGGGGGGSGNIIETTFSGDINVTTALEFYDLPDSEAIGDDVKWILFNFGRHLDNTSAAYAGEWHMMSRAEWDDLTVVDAGDDVAQGNAKLYRDFIDPDITSSSGITARDSYMGKDADDKPIFAGANTGEDYYSVTVIYQAQEEPASGDLVTVPITLPRIARGEPGSLTEINITDGGMNYSVAPTVEITGGGGTGATARAFENSGEVDNITLNDLGMDYTSAPTVSFTKIDGSGATAEITNWSGIGPVTISNGGTGYSGTIQIQFTGGGETTPATGIATVTAGVITAIQIFGLGRGYTAEATAVITSGGGGGTGFAATAAFGGIAQIQVSNRGAGYYAAPTITLTGGGGSGVVLTPRLSGGEVRSFDITNSGSGYTSAPTITITNANTGSGAAATAVISPIDWTQILTADQWLDKDQLYVLLATEATTGTVIENWIIPTFFLKNQIAAQTAPVDLYHSYQNTAGTASYTAANGISNSFFIDVDNVTFYIAKDASNNLWAGYFYSRASSTYRILRIGAA